MAKAAPQQPAAGGGHPFRSSSSDAVGSDGPPPSPTAATHMPLAVEPPTVHTADDPLRSATAADSRLLLDAALGASGEAARQELDKMPARAANALMKMTSGHAVADPLSVVGEGIFDVEGAHDLAVVRDAMGSDGPPPSPTAATHMPLAVEPPTVHTSDDPLRSATAAYRLLLDAVLGASGEASRQELDKTPARAARAFMEMTSGHAVADPLSVVGEGIFDVEGAHDLVVVRDMPFHSLCEHHLLPFSGVAHVAYLPNGRVLGLSKFARLLKVFSQRLQLQERLTQQVADTLDRALAPQAVAVAVEATHACMCMRGIASPARTRTLVVRGELSCQPHVRSLLLTGLGASDSGGAPGRSVDMWSRL